MVSAKPNFLLSLLVFIFSLIVVGYVGHEFIQAMNNGYVEGRMGAVYPKGDSHYGTHLVLYGVGIVLGIILGLMSLKWMRARS